MKNRLDVLMKKASTAQPPAVQARSTWLPYVPVVRVLMDQRAHSLQAAVEWLVRQGEIPQERQGMAYRALRQILARREAKRLRQQARALGGAAPEGMPGGLCAEPGLTNHAESEC